MIDKRCIGSTEVCKALGIGRSSFYALTKSGTIPHIRVGRRILIPIKELDEWIHQNSIQATFNSYRKEENHHEQKTKTESSAK